MSNKGVRAHLAFMYRGKIFYERSDSTSLKTSSLHNLPMPSQHKRTVKRATMNPRLAASVGFLATFVVSGCMGTDGGWYPHAGSDQPHQKADQHESAEQH